MSSSGSSILREGNTAFDPTFFGENQLEATVEGGETSTKNEVPLVGDIPLDMEYARGLCSKYSQVDETFLRHNYDIMASVKLNFPGPDENVFPMPEFGDICPHRRMLMADFHFPLQPIIWELLNYLQQSVFQVLPKGWRLLLGSYMIWLGINPGCKMSVP
jgi:hypothetical protein